MYLRGSLLCFDFKSGKMSIMVAICEKSSNFATWASFFIKIHSKPFFWVARGFYTHFSVCKVILNRFLKQKMEFSASEFGTKSKCVKFIKPVLPRLNL